MPYTLLGTVEIETSEDVGVEFVIEVGTATPPFVVEFVPSSAVPNDWTQIGYAAPIQLVEGKVVIHQQQPVFALPDARSQITAPTPVRDLMGNTYPFGVVVYTRQLSFVGEFRVYKHNP